METGINCAVPSLSIDDLITDDSRFVLCLDRFISRVRPSHTQEDQSTA
jgi:hypothetical protein